MRNGVVVLDEPAHVPEGAEVEVRLVSKLSDHADGGADGGGAVPAWLQVARRLSEQMPDDLPTDLAEQHDHYIHGTPKRWWMTSVWSRSL
jgi:hypothetical protein